MKSLIKTKRDFGNVINAYACTNECGCSCYCSCTTFENGFSNKARPQLNNAGPSYSSEYSGGVY